MLLTIDVGNTHMVIGVMAGEEVKHHWRISTRGEKTEDEVGILILDLLERFHLSAADIDGIAVASVVPVLTESLYKMGEKYFDRKPFIIDRRSNVGMKILFRQPQEIGADRIANSLAAYRLYGGPIIVVDFGTATTFDYVTAQGEYVGGVIAPGIGISSEALFANAAKLSRVEYVKPPRVVGRNTMESIQSGLYYGFAGQVDGIIRNMLAEIGEKEMRIIATGGYGRLVERESKYIEGVEPLLTLYGLQMLYDENQN